MSRLCLDTSAYSHFCRGHAATVDTVSSAGWVGLPATAIGELWVGFLGGRRLERNARSLAEFLRNPTVHEIPTDAHVAGIYAEILTTLRQEGKPLPTNDVWIAAAAASTGSVVLTFDEHFRAIARVGVLILIPD